MMARFAFRLLRLRCLLLALAVLAGGIEARAQSFPGGNIIRIVSPTGPGAPPDVLGRVIANEIADAEGWRVIVENKPGALQTIAIADVLKQPADGLSVLTMSTGAVATPALLPTKGIQLEADFAPVVEIAAGPLTLVVHPSVPANSMSELIALMKATPDKFTLSSGGFGTPAHLSAEMFKVATGVRVVHVPHPQPQQRMADLLGGITQVAFYNLPAVIDHVAAGRLRALAVTSRAQLGALKGVPTVGEQGFPALVLADWQGFVVKRGSPSEAIATLNAAVNRAIGKTKVRDALARVGYEPVGGTAEAFGNLISSEVRHWGRVVAEAGIKASP
jgi:tripartite-type tricarboxylate transporter receptor subunit TctC